MAVSDFATLYAGTGPVSKSAAILALEKRVPYVIAPAENPQALTPGNITTLSFNGVTFWYDSADALTAHDGTSCIVTADGKRFKSDQFHGRNSRIIPVIDQNLATPPGSPTVGDTYIVASSGTGAWAGKDEYFASWTARGWSFILPSAFDMAYVEDEATFYHYSAGGVWTSGLPGVTQGADSLSINTLKYFKLGVSVANQTTNTPPGSPSNGDAYIVGTVPTGAWVGHARDVAIYESGAWVYYVPYEGAQVYDKSLDKLQIYSGSVWVSGSGFDYLAKNVSPATGAATLTVNNTIITKAYQQLVLKIQQASHDNGSSRSLRIELSGDNGSSFTSPITLTNVAAAASGLRVQLEIDDAGSASATRIINGTSGESYATAIIFAATASVTTGYINCLRFSWSGAGNFDAFTFTLIGIT